MKTLARAAGWSVALALVVLGARSLTYALSPSPLAAHFQGQAGGPGLPAVTLVSILLALALSAAIVWLAALGVRERRLLAPPAVEAPRIRLGALALRAFLLFAAAAVAFALLESYLHWRAGLGWHGLHCLVGPAHRDAIPLLAGLSLIASAAVTAVEHVLAWMQRTIASIRAPRPRLAPARADRRPGPERWAPPRPVAGPLGARAPPLPVS
jgi:hypothetical protein